MHCFSEESAEVLFVAGPDMGAPGSDGSAEHGQIFLGQIGGYLRVVCRELDAFHHLIQTGEQLWPLDLEIPTGFLKDMCTGEKVRLDGGVLQEFKRGASGVCRREQDIGIEEDAHHSPPSRLARIHRFAQFLICAIKLGYALV